MTSVTVERPPPRVLGLWRSHIGKKAVMALSGAVLAGYVLVHMAGNLQFFLGRDQLDSYAADLQAATLLLWSVRALLLVSVVLHAVCAVQLVRADRAARPARYAARLSPVRSTYASRTMVLSGLLLLGFIVFHILHLTTGHAHPRFQPGAAYDNLVSGLGVVPVALFYLLAMAALCLHLHHGLFSLTQSLGLHHPRYTPLIRRAALAFAGVVATGFAALPVAILLGVGD